MGDRIDLNADSEHMKQVQDTIGRVVENFPLTEEKVLPPVLAGLPPGEAVRRLSDYYTHSLLLAARLYGGGVTEEARTYARRCWRDALPDPDSKRDTLNLLACIAWGMRHSLLEPNEGKMLCYIAQTCLTVQRMIAEDETPPSPPLAALPLFQAEKPPLEGELIGRPGQNSMDAPAKKGGRRG